MGGWSRERGARRETEGKCMEEGGVGSNLSCAPNDTPEPLYLAVYVHVCTCVCGDKSGVMHV